MTRGDQMQINTAYASIRDALNALAQVRDKDNYLAHMLRTLYQWRTRSTSTWHR